MTVRWGRKPKKSRQAFWSTNPYERYTWGRLMFTGLSAGGFQMNAKEIIAQIEEGQKKETVPEFNTGDTVRVSNRIKEGDHERIQVFEGVVLKKQGGSNRETFTVRKISSGIGVEKTFPLHSPNVVDVKVVRKGKVRRAKLNYLRSRVGKSAKVKETI